MAYTDLLKRLSIPHNPQYYIAIIDHRADILKRIRDYGQVAVAEDIGMSQAKLSPIAALLRASISSGTTVYYITRDNDLKPIIGTATQVAEALSFFPDKLTITTWNMDATDAGTLMAYICERVSHEEYPTDIIPMYVTLDEPLSDVLLTMLDNAVVA